MLLIVVPLLVVGVGCVQVLLSSVLTECLNRNLDGSKCEAFRTAHETLLHTFDTVTGPGWSSQLNQTLENGLIVLDILQNSESIQLDDILAQLNSLPAVSYVEENVLVKTRQQTAFTCQNTPRNWVRPFFHDLYISVGFRSVRPATVTTQPPFRVPEPTERND